MRYRRSRRSGRRGYSSRRRASSRRIRRVRPGRGGWRL